VSFVDFVMPRILLGGISNLLLFCLMFGLMLAIKIKKQSSSKVIHKLIFYTSICLFLSLLFNYFFSFPEQIVKLISILFFNFILSGMSVTIVYICYEERKRN
jgi:hypothetical protein